MIMDPYTDMMSAPNAQCVCHRVLQQYVGIGFNKRDRMVKLTRYPRTFYLFSVWRGGRFIFLSIFSN